MPTTRFPDGVNNAFLPSVFENMGQLDPSKFHNFFEDFDRYSAADWIITNVGTPSQVLLDGDGGLLLVQNSAADDDSSFLAKKGESFLFETGKALFFKARLSVSSSLESDFVMGLQIIDPTPLSTTDGVFFRKDDNDMELDFVVVKNSISTDTKKIFIIPDNTLVSMGFFYNGKDKIDYFVNDVFLGSVPVDNLPDDEELTISFGLQNGSGSVRSMVVDYIQVAKER